MRVKGSTEDILLSLKGSIAIVGNGAICNKGKQIDSFDQIIRFNTYVIEGYEEHVGTKTTVWCTWGNPKKPLKDVRPMISPFPCNGQETVKPSMFPDMAYLATERRFIEKVHRPTTGGMLVSLCSYLKIPVVLFGFDGMQSNHYYDLALNPLSAIIHKHAPEEFTIISRLPGVTIG